MNGKPSNGFSVSRASWRFPADLMQRLAPGTYRLRATLVLAGGTGWKDMRPVPYFTFPQFVADNNLPQRVFALFAIPASQNIESNIESPEPPGGGEAVQYKSLMTGKGRSDGECCGRPCKRGCL